MSDSPQASTEHPARFTRTITIDPQFAHRNAMAGIRFILLSPNALWTMTMSSLVLSVGLVVLFRPSGTVLPVLFISALLALPVLWAIAAVRGYRRGLKFSAIRTPVGSTYTLTLTDEFVRVQDSMVTIEFSYRLYKSLSTTKTLVVLHERAGRGQTLLPREIFTPESLNWLARRLRTSS